MAKGSQLKQEISQKILELFKGNSFLYNDGKEIRINGIEDGVPMQIKCVLTASKTPVGLEDSGDEDAAPALSFEEKHEKVPDEPTSEEKARLARLLASLGM